jgi:hypothetical protein
MSDRGSRRWWALGAVFLTILCVGVDSTVTAAPRVVPAQTAAGNPSSGAVAGPYGR